MGMILLTIALQFIFLNFGESLIYIESMIMAIISLFILTKEISNIESKEKIIKYIMFFTIGILLFFLIPYLFTAIIINIVTIVLITLYKKGYLNSSKKFYLITLIAFTLLGILGYAICGLLGDELKSSRIFAYIVYTLNLILLACIFPKRYLSKIVTIICTSICIILVLGLSLYRLITINTLIEESEEWIKIIDEGNLSKAETLDSKELEKNTNFTTLQECRDIHNTNKSLLNSYIELYKAQKKVKNNIKEGIETIKSCVNDSIEYFFKPYREMVFISLIINIIILVIILIKENKEYSNKLKIPKSFY